MLKDGTDCSGMEAPIEALKQLRVPHEHVFSSEINKAAISWIKHNHRPTHLYGNMLERNNNDTASVDLYCAGFPCQPYSSMNAHKNTADERKTPMHVCISYIKHHRPKYFLLENVRAFVNTNEFKYLLKRLNEIPGYKIDHKVLSPIDYNCPQSRNRVFIVGRRGKRNISWPKPVILKKSVMQLLDDNTTSKNEVTPAFKRMLNTWKVPPSKKGIVEFNAVSKRFPPSMDSPIPSKHIRWAVKDDIAPCMVAHNPGHYVNHLDRLMTHSEMLKLQGFRGNISIPHDISHPKMVKLVGNSMNVNVLKAIFHELLQF